MDESFWLLLNKHNVLLELTKYPIKVDYDNILKKTERYSVETRIVNIDKKSSYKAPLDLEGKQDVRESYLNCYHANNCVALKDGKIYTCTIAPNIERFNKYFDKHLKLSERDGKLYRCPTGVFVERYNKYFNQNIPKDEGINIYNATVEDIRKYLNTPFETCRYCLVSNRKKINWEISKRDKNEWFADKI